ncbi:MAG: PQQ-binding-like beta-propeller repeat protein [Planctomycetota bacterium]
MVAYFGSFGLICFDHQGEERWRRPMPKPRSFGGNATSPALFGNRLILYRGNHVDHYLTAIDKRNGKIIWKVEIDEPFTDELACTSCPIRHGNQVILHAARSVQFFDLMTGRREWQTKAATTATSTPVIIEDQVIVAAWNKMGEPSLRPSFPSFAELISEHDANRSRSISKSEFPKLWLFHRPDGMEAPMNGATIRFSKSDHNRDGIIDEEEWEQTLAGIEAFRSGYQTHGVLAIPLEGQQDHRLAQVRTLVKSSVPEVPSPIAYEGVIYTVKNGGVLTSIDYRSGDMTARLRTKGTGTHYASPVIGGDHLYTVSGDGLISVLSLGAKPEVIATNQMPARVFATPAISDGVLYVRTHERLHAFSRIR